MTDLVGDVADLPPQSCPHCHTLVPPGQFCGNCGATLAATEGRARLHSFAAAPHEHVLQVTVLSTLFPHLPRRHAHVFRVALGAGTAVVVGLVAGRLFAPATVVAAALIPVLYLLYLYEVEVYEHEPLLVLGVTFVAGLALGAAYTLVVDHLAVPDIDGHTFAWPVQALLLPVVAQGLMVVGPLLLLSRPHFDEALDGLSFGAASALGFTLATVLTSLWHVLTGPLLADGSTADEILRLARLALLGALVNASATAIITASVWLHRHRRSPAPGDAAWRRVGVAAALVLAVQVGLGIAGYLVTDLLPLVALSALAAVVLILSLRLVIHHALLDEAAEHGIGAIALCPECHHLVPTMSFCPACGVSRSAAPKQVRRITMEQAP